jgi:hypothetical protein
VRSWLALPFIFVLSSAKTPTSCVDEGRQALLIVHGLFDLELPMRYETLTLGGNVIRFPVELRAKPSIDLLLDVAPDSREVELIAEAFGFDAPDPEGRTKADRAMAERIAAMDLPVDRQERRAALKAILMPFVDRAVAACAQARQASLRSDAENEKFARAQMEGGYWLAPLKEAADYWAVEAARLQIVAHEAAQTAHAWGGRSSSQSAPRRGGPRTPRTT